MSAEPRSPLALAAALVLVAAGAATPAEALKPERVQITNPGTGPQVPVPSPAGRGDTVLVGGNPLAARTLGPDLAFGEVRDLGLTLETGDLRPLRAARNELGDWLIAAANRLHWLRGGHRQRLPTPPDALVWDLAFFDGSPVVAVSSVAEPGPGGVPLVLRWGGARWEPLVFEAVSRDEPAGGAAAAVRRTQQTASVLHAASDGTLWIGFVYRHRLLQLGSDGRILRELQVGDGGPEMGRADPAARGLLEREAEAMGSPHPGRRATAGVNTARRRIDALAEGPDGAIYLLAVRSGEDGTHALERFEPRTGLLTRTPLHLSEPGPVRMAGAPFGLVLASGSAARGAGAIRWEAIAAADWTPVPGATILRPPIPTPP